nr:MAG TPA: hypothetical protein [Caudoviricetes sp.]
MALPYVSVSASSSGNRYITVTGRMNWFFSRIKW